MDRFERLTRFLQGIMGRCYWLLKVLKVWKPEKATRTVRMPVSELNHPEVSQIPSSWHEAMHGEVLKLLPRVCRVPQVPLNPKPYIVASAGRVGKNVVA